MGDDDNLIFDTEEPSKRPAVDIDCPVEGGVFGDHWDLFAECKACELDGACCDFFEDWGRHYPVIKGGKS
jgi:hypothetical protein